MAWTGWIAVLAAAGAVGGAVRADEEVAQVLVSSDTGVHAFALDGTPRGTLIAAEPTGLRSPQWMAMGPDRRLYVADYFGAVGVYDLEGRRVGTVGEGDLRNPAWLGIRGDTLLVSEIGGHRIRRWRIGSDGVTGPAVLADSAGGVRAPHAIVPDGSGAWWVAEPGRIGIVDAAGGSAGTAADEGLIRPRGLLPLDDGRLLVADFRAPRPVVVRPGADGPAEAWSTDEVRSGSDGVARLPDGEILIAYHHARQVRRYSAGGEDRGPFAWGPALGRPNGILVVDAGARPSIREVWRVGGAEAAGGLELGAMEPGRHFVALAADGAVVVADPSVATVHRLSAETGHPEASFGGRGDGPAEFGREIQAVVPFGDDLAVQHDLVRVTIVSLTGEARSRFALDPAAGIPLAVGEGPGRTLAVHFRAAGDSEAARPDPLVLVGEDGQSVRELRRLPRGQAVTLRRDGPPLLRLFGAEPLWTTGAGGERLAVASTDSGPVEIEVVDGSWDGARSMDAVSSPAAVDDAEADDLRSAFEASLVRAGAPAEAAQAMAAGLEVADGRPVRTGVFFGPDGTTWVQRPASGDTLRARGFGRLRPADLGSSTWDVFDGDGRLLGPVVLPDRFTPTVSDGPSVYGYGLDAADVPYVARLEISQG